MTEIRIDDRHILTCLLGESGMTRQVWDRLWRMGAAFGIDQVFRRLNALEKRGLVEKAPTAYRRQYRWAITVAGREVIPPPASDEAVA